MSAFGPSRHFAASLNLVAIGGIADIGRRWDWMPQFEPKQAKHTFCKHCGIHPFYVPRSDPDKIDVNVRCIDGVDLATLKPEYFDGKHWEDAQKFWQQS